jgi:hypothetical protein
MSIKHITGRKKVPNYAGLTTGRDIQLRIEEAEPNLGFPTEKSLPLKSSYYQLVTYDGGDVGERYWQVAPGTAVTGISLFDEGFIVGTGNSITILNFAGVSIAATATPFDNIGYITVTPPGNDTEILFKESGDFSTSSAFTFNQFTDTFKVGVGGSIITALGDGRVGINSTIPERTLDVNGDINLTGTIYDFNGLGGNPTDIITKNSLGGIEWIARTNVKTAAGGTIGNVQFHGNDGSVDGSNDFNFIKSTGYVGLGTTAPRKQFEIQNTRGTVILGELLNSTVGTAYNGLQFIESDISLDSAVAVKSGGRNINLGINVEQLGSRDTTRVGGIVRVDSRKPSEVVFPAPAFGNSQSFVVKGVPLSGSFSDEYNAQVIDLDTGNTYLSPEKGAVAIGTESISTRLNVFGYGLSNGIRIGDMQLSTFDPVAPVVTNNNFKGSPTFRNLNTNAKTNLRVIPNGTQTAQLEVFATDYFAGPTTWNNFRIFPDGSYIRLDTSSGSSGTPKDISIETDVDETGVTRNNPNQLYLKTDGNVGINKNNPTRKLDVNGSFGLSGEFFSGDGTSGGANFVLQSTGAGSTKWTSLLSLTVGTAQQANVIKTVGITTNKTFYLPFVDDNNLPPGSFYEGLYTNVGLKVNPNDATISTGKFTFKGKSIIGNSVDIASINTFAIPGTVDGVNAFRSLNVIDTDASIKVTRLTGSAFDAAIDLQVRSADGTVPRSLWDYYAGIYGSGSRNHTSGSQRSGFFISNSGNFLLGSSLTSPVDLASESLNSGSTNILQVLGDSYISGSIGIGTSSQTNSLEVVGDAYISGAFKDSLGNTGTDGEVLTSVSNGLSPSGRGTEWSPVSGLAVESAQRLATPQDFSITGDGSAPAVSFDGQAEVILNLTLDTTGVAANTYGNNTTIPVFEVDAKGRILAVTPTAVNFTGATVGQADKIKTQSNTAAVAEHFLTFVDSNTAAPGDYEDVYTNDAIAYVPNINTLKLKETDATSTNRAALWLSGASGAILLDNGGNKRVSYNDGGGDFTIRSGSYFLSGEKYVIATGSPNSGAGKISINNEASAGEIDLEVAAVGTPGDPVTYGTRIRLSQAANSLLPLSVDTDLGTNTNQYGTVYASTFQGKFIGVADDAKQLSIGQTSTVKDYYPSFVANLSPEAAPVFDDFFTDAGFKITKSLTDVKLTTTGNIVNLNGTEGSVALTLNDGQGDANITFNHENGVPAIDGNAARISCNINTASISALTFQTSSGTGGVSAGVGVALSSRAHFDDTGLIPAVNAGDPGVYGYHLGSPSRRWNNVYAETFNGTFVGTADMAEMIQTQELGAEPDPVFLTFVQDNNAAGTPLDETLYTNRNITYNINSNLFKTGNIDGERLYAAGIATVTSNLGVGNNLSVSGNASVTGSITGSNSISIEGAASICTGVSNNMSLNGGLVSNIIPKPARTRNLGSNPNRFNEIWAVTVNAENLVGTASSSSQIITQTNSTSGAKFLTFVTNNFAAPAQSSVFTNVNITYDPVQQILSSPKITTTDLIANGSTTLGDNINNDKLAINARIQDNLIPDASNLDIGSSARPWNTIYANSLIGTAGASANVRTVQDDTGQTNYLTFVKTNSTSAVDQELYTNPSLVYDAVNDQLELNNTRITDFSILRYGEVVQNLGSRSGTVTLNVAAANVFTVTLAGNCNFNIQNAPAGLGSGITVFITNAGAGPIRTVSFPGVKFSGAVSPTRTETAGRTDIWTFVTPDGGTTWYGNIALFDFA